MKFFGRQLSRELWNRYPDQATQAYNEFVRNVNQMASSHRIQDKEGNQVIVIGQQPADGPVSFGIVKYDMDGDKHINPVIVV